MREHRITQILCVAGGMIVAFVDAGIYRAETLIFENVLDKYGASKTETGWAFGLNNLVIWGGSFIPMWLSSKIGCRAVVILGGFLSCAGLVLTGLMPSLPYLYVTYGLMLGLGSTATWDPAFVILNQHFDKRKGRAFGIATAGDPIGGFVMAPVVQLLFDTYGYRGATMLLGAFALHDVFAGFLMKSPRKITNKTDHTDIQDTKDGDTLINGDTSESHNEERKHLKIKFKETWGFCCNSSFLAILFCLSVHMIGRNSINTYMAGMAGEKEISRMQSALILSICSGLSLPATVIIGFVFDLRIFRQRRALLFGIMISLYGIISALLPLAHSVIQFGIVWSLSSVISNAYNQHMSVLGDIAGKENLMKAVGLTGIIRAVFSFAGPIIGGALRDRTGAYNLTFFIGGLASATGGVVLLVTESVKSIKSREKSKELNYLEM